MSEFDEGEHWDDTAWVYLCSRNKPDMLLARLALAEAVIAAADVIRERWTPSGGSCKCFHAPPLCGLCAYDAARARMAAQQKRLAGEAKR